MASEWLEHEAITLPFDVPEDWATSPLGAQCHFVRDGDWIETKDQGGSDYRLLQISNIGLGQFVETGNFRWITEETFRRLNCTEILPGDVLVARMPDPTGRAWHVTNLPWRAVTAVDVAIIRTKSQALDPRFLAYFLNSPACLSLVHSLTTGTTRLRLRRADLERLEVPLPPLSEQRAIAHILGTLDDKIELNRRMSETLEAMARALFRAWFVDFEPVRAKMEGRWQRGQSLPGLPAHLYDLFPARLVDSELGEIPEGWDVASVATFAEVSSGKRPTARFAYPSPSASVPLWGGNGPMGFVEEPLFSEPIIITGRVGTLGSVFRITTPCWPSDNTLVIRPAWPAAFEYIFFQLSEIDFSSLNRGSTQPLVTQSDLKSQLLLLPSSAVLDCFSRIVGRMYGRIDQNEHESHTLAALRDALLPKLISGELRVKDAEKFIGRAI